MAAARRLLSLLLALAWARPAGCTDPPDGGWLAGTVPEEERCTVERADASLSYSVFLQRFAFSRPVILRGVTDNSVRVRAGAAPRSPPGGQGLPGAAGLAPALPARSGRALPGVRGAAAEAAGSGQAGQRHPLLLRGQQLHRVGPPLPAVRAPRLPHPGHQPCLQLWDRSAGFCTRRIKHPTSTPTRQRWPGSTARTPRCHRPSGRWSVPCAPGSRSCTSPTAGGTPRSTWTPASSSPPSWGRGGKAEDAPPPSRPRRERAGAAAPAPAATREGQRQRPPTQLLVSGPSARRSSGFYWSFPSPLD
ncbi:jmjC domain-containing protein 8 isoform X4 [Ciconia boyciana]|uniref:jmjC domain-containing protein 8 isoform X4 n=1 Tax=Ciconia boyciana TaxID=52775 RepID=UPI003BA2DBB6